jgi:DNA-binding transcriptional MocR family regulator
MPVAKANETRRRTEGDNSAWIARLRARDAGDGPVYLAIADALAGAIEQHELNPGDRLPAQRALAATLGVDLTTITRAYAHARAKGLLDGEAGRGTFVRAAGQFSREMGGAIVDLSMNLPPQPHEFPVRALMTEGVTELFKVSDPAALMTYRSGLGSRRDRKIAAVWLAP